MTEDELKLKEAELSAKAAELEKKEAELKSKEGSKDESGFDDKVKKAVDEALKDIKTKLDAAYAKRDEALDQVKAFEKKEQEARIEKLKEEGKHREAFELEKKKWEDEKVQLLSKNTELTRDIEVKGVLSKYDFRSDSARKMADDEIKRNLVKGDDGIWKHKSGISIEDFVKTFAENDDNSFLFKVKASSGGGTKGSEGGGAGGSGGTKSLFKMTQGEVLAAAAKGKLPHQSR